MVIHDYISNELHSKQEQPFFKEGIKIWNQERERERFKHIQEQKQMREMLDRYWPWNKPIKPRGLGNLRLEEIFPDDELRKSNRLTGNINLGKPGGGAPNASFSGKIIVRTREDPMLRFQWGKDLRQAVDNTIRYRRNKHDQEEYKRQLDKLVNEKQKLIQTERDEKLQQERQLLMKTPPWGKPGPGGAAWRQPKNIGLNFMKSMGWSDERTLNEVDNEYRDYKEKINKLVNFKTLKFQVPNHGRTIGKENIKNYVNIKPYKLSPLQKSKGNEVDLVNVIAKKRYHPLASLSTTDVTNDKRDETLHLNWKNDSNIYLRELVKQMNCRNQKLKQIKEEDRETVQHHFATLDGFWGRPGHGAPRSATRRGHLDRMLFPQVLPVGVA